MIAAAPDFATGTDPSVLGQIPDADTALVIWEREPAPETTVLLRELVETRLPLALDVVLQPGDRFRATPEVTEQFGDSIASPALCSLLQDVDDLVARFRKVSGAATIRVRLSRVVDAACAVFHADTLRLRMICTYHGAGTQWVPDSAVHRNQLGLRGRSIHKANRSIVPDPSEIREMPPWHVAIFKGRSHEHGRLALVHRSAPQCCEGHARIRLVLDLADRSPAAC